MLIKLNNGKMFIADSYARHGALHEAQRECGLSEFDNIFTYAESRTVFYGFKTYTIYGRDREEIGFMTHSIEPPPGYISVNGYLVLQEGET